MIDMTTTTEMVRLLTPILGALLTPNQLDSIHPAVGIATVLEETNMTIVSSRNQKSKRRLYQHYLPLMPLSAPLYLPRYEWKIFITT